MFLLGKMPTNNYKIKIQKLYQSYLIVKIMKAMTKFNKKQIKFKKKHYKMTRIPIF